MDFSKQRQTTLPGVSRAGRRAAVRMLLPAYNEAADLGELLGRLDRMFRGAGLMGDALVINDGSTDDTAQVVRGFLGELRVDLLDLQPNRGLGGALRAGLEQTAADLHPEDVAVVMDADNSHPPDLVPRMLQQLREGSDLVIASRFQPGSRVHGVSAYRRVLSAGASLLFRWGARVPHVRDYTCGFRAYRVGLLQAALARYGSALIEEPGFGCMAELLLKLKPLRPIIHEVPMILRYDQKRGRSKMHVTETIRATVRLLVRHAYGR